MFYNNKHKKIKINGKEYCLNDDEHKIVLMFIKKLPERLTSSEIAGELRIERNTATKKLNSLKDKYPEFNNFIINGTRHSKGYKLNILPHQINVY